MKIVVIGGTGLIGSKVVTILRQGGHEVVAASPSSGVNTLTGEGLTELLARVKSSIVWDEMPATVTTKTFKRVKEFVLALKMLGYEN